MQNVSFGNSLHEISKHIFKKNVLLCRLLKILPSLLSFEKDSLVNIFLSSASSTKLSK